MALSKPTGKLAFAYQSIAVLEAARKQDEALLLQLVEALGVATTPLAKDRQEVLAAITAARKQGGAT